MSQIDQSITDYLDEWTSNSVPTEQTQAPQKRGKGRPATGRTTRTVRIPLDLDLEKAMQMYYEWLPVIEKYRDTISESPKAVRNEKIVKLFEDLGIL